MVKIAIVIYSTYGHILTVSKAEAEGASAAGADVDVYQLPSGEQKDASASAGLPVITPSKLAEYDGVLFGIPSRFGSHPYAFKAFLDATGAQWASGSYYGKYAGFFVTTGTQGGGQESVIRNSLSVLAHHGFIYVPLGYARAFGEITNLNEVHGGSPWGAGSIAGPSGARQPSKLELDTARIQGKSFSEIVARGIGKPLSGSSAAGAGAVGAAGAGAAGAGAAGAGAAGAGAAGAGAAGAGAAGAGASGAHTSGAAGTTGTTGTTGAAGTAGTRDASGAATGPDAAAGTAAGAGTGAAGAAASAPKDLETKAGNAESEAKDFESKAAHGPDAVKDDAANAGEKAKSAPGKAEKAADNAENDAKESAEKEKEGCCKCM